MSAATESDVTREGVPCPGCGERHHFGVFVREDGCPDCDRTMAELRAIERGGRA